MGDTSEVPPHIIVVRRPCWQRKFLRFFEEDRRDDWVWGSSLEGADLVAAWLMVSKQVLR